MCDIHLDIKAKILSSDIDEVTLAELKESYQGTDQEDLWRELVRDELAGHLVDKLNIIGIQIEEDKRIVAADISISVCQLMDELDRISQHLQDFDVAIVALKNAGITRGIYSNYACSQMGDLDFLVRRRDFWKAHHLLTNDLKYTFEFRSSLEPKDIEEAFFSGGTEYYRDIKGRRIWVELQWRPIAGRWIQPHLEPDGDELMDRSLPIEGTAARILCPEDNLLQVCLHTAKHSYCRAPGFRLHSDVDRIVRFTDVDWNIFNAAVEGLHVKTAVYYSLLIPKVLLKTPIPDEVVNRIEPPKWKRKLIEWLLRKAGLTDQTKRKFTITGYIFFNLLLYDRLSDALRGILPSSDQMKERYQFTSSLLLPYYHFVRLGSLIFKRAKL
ncbi:MAG: nucleotidyltransferase family protein [Saprospiraceae bacterium]|nr:nucleotidyltransferase family protein [Saprospiraceae bacterium]